MDLLNKPLLLSLSLSLSLSVSVSLSVLLLLLLLLLKIRTAIDDIEAGFVIGSVQQQVA